MHLEQFFVDGLGHTSYLLASERTGDAVVVDPRRDIDIYVQAASRAGFRIRYVLETHVHNDFLSGARILTAETGAQHVASAEAGLRFRYLGVSEGDSLPLGELELAVLRTPGHTPEHVSYVVVDQEQADASVAVFTGGDLLVGGVGRVDLLGPALARQLAPQLYDSLFGKLLQLPRAAAVLPTHGPGSLCAVDSGTETTSTIGRELDTNSALKFTVRTDFVRNVLANPPFTPAYYRRMRRANQVGATAFTPTVVPQLSIAELRHTLGHGARVIDTRPAEQFQAGHLAGALHIARSSMLPTWLGTLVDAETPLVLVLDHAEAWGEITTALARIGYEHVAGWVRGAAEEWLLEGLPVTVAGEIAPSETLPLLERSDLTLLDVRTSREWAVRHVDGAVHIPLNELPARLHEIPISHPVAVICGSGYRSSIAASLLRPRHPMPVLNVESGMAGWVGAGLPTGGGSGVAAADPGAHQYALDAGGDVRTRR